MTFLHQLPGKKAVRVSAVLLMTMLLWAPSAAAQQGPHLSALESAQPLAEIQPEAKATVSEADRQASPVQSRMALRQQMLRPVRLFSASHSAHEATRGPVDLNAADGGGSNTVWYVVGGAVVAGLAVGAAVLLSGGGSGGSGEGGGDGIPRPPDRP